MAAPRGAAVPRPRDERPIPVSTSPTTTPRRSPASAGRSTACHWRSSLRRSASACSRRRRCWPDSTMCSPCWCRARATCPSVSGPSARRWSGASTCSARMPGPCSRGSACSRATSASTPSRRSRPVRRGPTTVLDTVLELVDGSLLRQHDDAGTPFFSMLVPVRELAVARLEQDPDAAAVRRAHAEHYVRLAVETEPLLRGSTQLDGARPARGGTGQPPIGLPAPHRPRRLGPGRRRGLAPAAVLVDPQPASRGEGMDGGCARLGRAALGSHPRHRARTLGVGLPVAARHGGRPGADRGERRAVPGEMGMPSARDAR